MCGVDTRQPNRLSLRFMFCTNLQVRVKVVAVAQLQYSAKTVAVDLKYVKQAHDALVLHTLHDAVLPRLPSRVRIQLNVLQTSGLRGRTACRT